MSHDIQSERPLLDGTSKNDGVKSLTVTPCLNETPSAIGALTSSLESLNVSSSATKPTNATGYGKSSITIRKAVEGRWDHEIPDAYFLDPRDITGFAGNHEIPNAYFLDPRSNTRFADLMMQHDSGHSTSSYYSSNSLKSSYPSRSYPGAQLPSSELPSTSNTLSANDSTSALPTSPLTPLSSTPKLGRDRHFCDRSDCVDRNGQRSSFSRRADLSRHTQAMHNSQLLDCPFRQCERKGDRGFPRLDHLIEHRRGYHHEHIPKREAPR
jgi:hypothetical protein